MKEKQIFNVFNAFNVFKVFKVFIAFNVFNVRSHLVLISFNQPSPKRGPVSGGHF